MLDSFSETRVPTTGIFRISVFLAIAFLTLYPVTCSAGLLDPLFNHADSGPVTVNVSFTNNTTGDSFSGYWIRENTSAGWLSRIWQSAVVLPDGSIILMGGYGWVNNQGIFYNDVWRSTDNGATWTQVTPHAEWSPRHSQSSVALPDGSIVLMGGNAETVYVNDTWRSSDKGMTWTRMNASSGWTRRSNPISAAIPDGSILLIGGLDGSGRKNDTWRSEDNGATWTLINTDGGWRGRFSPASVVNPDGSILIMGGGTEGNGVLNDTWRSADNGNTWQEMTAHAGWSERLGAASVVMEDGSVVLLGGVDGRRMNDMWISIDNGTTWMQMTADSGWLARMWHSGVTMPDGSIVIMGGSGNKGDFNDTWRFIPTGFIKKIPKKTVPVIHAPVPNFSANITFGSVPLSVAFTDLSTGSPIRWDWDFGDGSFVKPGYNIQNASTGWLPRDSSNSVALPDNSIVLIGGTINDVWRSSDRGLTWTLQNASAGWTGRIGATSVVLPDGKIILAGGDDGEKRNDVWQSTDQGLTWTQVTGHAEWPARHGHMCDVLPDGSIILMGGSDGWNLKNDVWRSTDDGATWTEQTASAEWPPRTDSTSEVLSDGSLLVIGGGCVPLTNDIWRSTDMGVTWTQVVRNAEWKGRCGYSSNTMPDGSIFLIGGYNEGMMNDVWQSSDGGTRWIQLTPNTEWTERDHHSSVALQDGSIIVIGGNGKNGSIRDVWRYIPDGVGIQNPVHTFTQPGNYTVTLKVYPIEDRTMDL